jgi:hypothetical protein
MPARRKRNAKIAKAKAPLRRETGSRGVSAAMGPGSSGEINLQGPDRRRLVVQRQFNLISKISVRKNDGQ